MEYFTHHLLEIKLYGKYIKAKEINQCSKGKVFNIPLIDDGNFWILIFDKRRERRRIDLNELLGIDRSTKTINGFPDPIMNATFIQCGKIFGNLFHNRTFTHWHFVYDYEKNRMVHPPVKIKLTDLFNCSILNFPHDNFFDPSLDKVHIFYRQGQVLSVDIKRP